MPGLNSEVQILNPSNAPMGDAATPVRIDPTGTTSQPVIGAGAAGSAPVGNPVQVAGTDGANLRVLLTDSSGRQIAVGAAASGSAVVGNPVLIGGSDGANARTIATDASGRPIVVGAGAAGAPVGGIVSVQVPDTTASGALNALNAAVQVALAGTSEAGMQLAAGTLIGTIVPEVSFDGGTTWVTTFFDDPTADNKVASIVFGSSNTATARTIVGAGGASHARVRVSAFTSGTATANVRATTGHDPSTLYSGAAAAAAPPSIAQVGGPDGGALLRALAMDTTGLAMTGDFAYAAAIARISGAIAGVRSGFSSAGGTPQPLRATVYTEPAAAAQRSVSSSNVNDTGAGTGAQQVTITYYDATGAGPNTEVVTLNGTTAVNTTNTNIKFIESIKVTRVGTGLVNAGTITLFVTTGGAGGTIGTIGVGNRAAGTGDNETFWAHHYVANGKKMYLLGMSTSFTGVTTGETYGKSKDPTSATSPELQQTPPMGARQAWSSYPFRVPVIITGPARFTLYNSATGGNEVDGSFEFVEF